MPVVKFGNHVSNAAQAADEIADGGYSGPIPTERGIYPCYVKIFDLVTNKNGDPMLKGLAVVDVPKKHKFAKFNGYGIWFQQNITDQGKPFVNQLLNALSDGSQEHSAKIRKAFWTTGAQTEKPLPSKPQQSAGAILKIGPLRFSVDPDDKKIRILISGKPETYNGEPKLSAGKYVMKQNDEADVPDDDEDDEDEILEDSDLDEDDDEDLEDEDDDDSDEDEEDESDDEDDEDEDESDDEDDEDEDEGDEDEEPAPVTPIKKAASKKTTGAKKRGEPAF